MGVIVADSVTKSGSTVNGHYVKIVVVQDERRLRACALEHGHGHDRRDVLSVEAMHVLGGRSMPAPSTFAG